MRVSKQQAAENRKKVIEISSHLFRENGFDGIGIADLMKSAGMTHGGFYKQFKSKENLAEEACEAAVEENLSFWNSASSKGGKAGLEELFLAYLSLTHLNDRDTGCLLAALGAESPRRDSVVRKVFEKAVNAYASVLEALLPETSARKKRQKALAILPQMIGALMLSRAVVDEKLSQEILEATIQDLQRHI
ncbi:MAG: TetR/AcrR family transcriptional regulator [Methyloligellaceae bacterium]